MNEHFQRGFLKAAMSVGINPLHATMILKEAGGELGKSFGDNLASNSAAGLGGLKGLADGMKNFDFGGATSNAVNSVKENVGAAAPGIIANNNNLNEARNTIGGMGQNLATNGIPNAIHAFNQQGPGAIDELMKQYGKPAIESSAGTITSANNMQRGARAATGALGEGLAPMAYSKPAETVRAFEENTNSPLVQLHDYFTKGQGTNTMNALQPSIDQAGEQIRSAMPPWHPMQMPK